MKKLIIAIDGFSSCGKSTLAKQMAKILHYGYVDTGAMYRAVTLYLLEKQVDLADMDAIKVHLPNIEIHFESLNKNNTTFLNGRNVEAAIRSMFVSESVSIVAAIPSVRRAMVRQQQAMGKRKGIVMDGRDIGTVVFPNADLKIFLTAEVSIRTQRRFDELKAKGIEVNIETVQKNLSERDRIDSTREDSPLKKADDAIEIDNSFLTEAEQLAMALELVKEKQLVLV